MPGPPKLAIRELCKRYGTAAALEPTSLDVRRGEFLTLLGPSGSGKTTLLMMIAGLVEPTGGTIRVDGRDVTGLPAFRRQIGVVFQNYALFPHLSVFENVAFPLRMRRKGEAEIKAAVTRALELVRLPQLGDRLPRELSGGQQQRIAFARAVVFEPAVILMDEPLGALDKKLRDELKLEIRKLRREIGATIVYVTHDQEEAMLLSDRICLMNHATVAQLDTPKRLYELPASRFAAEFVGESNILAGRAASDGVVVGDVVLKSALRERLPESGAAVDVLVRPERITLLGPRGSADTVLEARVASVIDLGGICHVMLDVQGLALKMTQLGSATTTLAAGDVVRLGIAAGDIVPLPREGARA